MTRGCGPGSAEDHTGCRNWRYEYRVYVLSAQPVRVGSGSPPRPSGLATPETHYIQHTSANGPQASDVRKCLEVPTRLIKRIPR